MKHLFKTSRNVLRGVWLDTRFGTSGVRLFNDAGGESSLDIGVS